MFRFMILCLILSACGASPSSDNYALTAIEPYPSMMVSHTEDRELPMIEPSAPLPPSDPFETLMMAADHEIGDWYAMSVPGRDAEISLTNRTGYKGDSITIPACDPTGAPVVISVHAGNQPPNGLPVPTGMLTGHLGTYTIHAPSAGPWILSVRLDFGVCLRAMRHKQPAVPQGQEWWIFKAGLVEDMAESVDSAQCSGPCPGSTWVVR